MWRLKVCFNLILFPKTSGSVFYCLLLHTSTIDLLISLLDFSLLQKKLRPFKK